MTKTAILTLLIIAAGLSCKKKEKEEADPCLGVTDATFSTNGGKVLSIITSKCTGSACHSAGGPGTPHWTYNANYDSLSIHFPHLMQAALDEMEMPPASAPQLTAEEVNQLSCWKKAGYPR